MKKNESSWKRKEVFFTQNLLCAKNWNEKNLNMINSSLQRLCSKNKQVMRKREKNFHWEKCENNRMRCNELSIVRRKKRKIEKILLILGSKACI